MRFDPIIGAALLATGRGRGIGRFGGSVQAFLASLAPLIAFPLVGAAFIAMSGRGAAALLTLLLTMVAQLAPPVVSFSLARRWDREAEWLRYATAFNWCQWALPVAAFVLLLAVNILAGGSVTEEQAAQVLVIGLAAYVLWLHWMVARHGLALGRIRSAVAVLVVNVVTGALVMLPRVLVQFLR